MKKTIAPKTEITAWITKYALTQGIIKTTGTIDTNISPDMFSYGEGIARASAFKGEWFTNVKDALAKAEVMRTKKIASLEKQITKMKNKKIKFVNI